MMHEQRFSSTKTLRKIKLTPELRLFKSKSAPEITTQQADEILESIKEPDLHFKKLKAKIKIKAVEKYHIYVKEQEEIMRKIDEPEEIIEIKDKFGRVVHRENPLMKNKARVPNESRLPKKLPPRKVLRSFVDDQKEYHDADDMYNPMAQFTGRN